MAGKFKGQSKTNNDGYKRARFGATFYQKGGGSNGSPVHNPGRTGKEPTFWEFITAILETGQRRVCSVAFQRSVACLVSAGLMDEHWMPIHELCSVCAKEMDYDFVVKFEQLAAEERYLLNRLVLTIELTRAN